MEPKELQLKKNEDRRLRAGHLWIYSNEVNTIATPLKQFSPGEQVRIISHSGKTLGSAYVNPKSLICARLFSPRVERLDQALLQKKIKQALSLRDRLFKDPCYRLVYGESDLLPGLVVDRFGDHLSVQLNSAGMDTLKDEIVETLKSLLKPSSILLRNDSSMRNLEGMSKEVVAAHGVPPEEVELIENGVKMLAPLYAGQKTGWFYDQRPNRAELGRFVQGKRVLDVFSYVGSFAIQAAAAGAKEVWAVDASRFALEMAEKNAKLNGVGDIFTGAQGDAFDVLKALRAEGEQFDVIVVDPPAFIKKKKDHKEGLRAYHRINELAMRLLPEEGILLSASCSMHLHRDDLLDVLRSGARKTRRHAQIVFEGMQGPDHPVHPAIAETKYLKAFIARLTQE
ncbi:MAG: RlmI/RlmK family 23S rRNA methyltransferase [Desulfotalea sp.]|nr:MAG: RlmI/RlmK family 23S rRNA methyltransferase [Desulfotalea sp.]